MNDEAKIVARSRQSDTILVRTLLRHYAYNLRRSWRNSRHNAFIDALVQVEVPLLLALVGPLALVTVALSRTVVPALANARFGKLGSGGIVVVAVSLAILWIVDNKLRPYEFIPGAEIGYDSANDRMLVRAYFVGGFFVVAAMLIGAYSLNRLFPASS